MQSRRFSEQGSSLIETALLLPVLLLLLVGGADFGRAWFLAIDVSSAAHAGALYGVQEPVDTAGMKSAAMLDGGEVSNLQTTSTYGCECSDGSSATPSCGTAPNCAYNVVNYVSVTATSVYSTLLPYPGIPSSFTLTATSRMRASH